MREKYVEERWPRLMDLGNCRDGRIGVCTVDDRVDIQLPPEQAMCLIEHWNKMQDCLSRCAIAFAEADNTAFEAFWYGT